MHAIVAFILIHCIFPCRAISTALHSKDVRNENFEHIHPHAQVHITDFNPFWRALTFDSAASLHALFQKNPSSHHFQFFRFHFFLSFFVAISTLFSPLLLQLHHFGDGISFLTHKFFFYCYVATCRCQFFPSCPDIAARASHPNCTSGY